MEGYCMYSFEELKKLVCDRSIYICKKPTKTDLVEALQLYDAQMEEYLRMMQIEKEEQRQKLIYIQMAKEKAAAYEKELEQKERQLELLKTKQEKTTLDYETMIEIYQILLEDSRRKEGCDDDSY
jgi:hypothetical protein